VKIKAITAAAIGAIIGIAGGWGLYAWWSEPPTADELNQRVEATVLPVDYARIPDVTLKTASGDFSRADLGERWTFLFFGFTHCPDVCPTTLQRLSIGVDEIRAKSETDPSVLFVSVDYRRDTPRSASSYANAFGPGFIGATAGEPVLRRLAKSVNVTFSLPDEPDSTDYSVQHSSAVFLLDSLGRVRALFGAPQDPEAVARDFLLLREALAQTS
jgi:protein SCO1/2